MLRYKITIEAENKDDPHIPVVYLWEYMDAIDRYCSIVESGGKAMLEAMYWKLNPDGTWKAETELLCQTK